MHRRAAVFLALLAPLAAQNTIVYSARIGDPAQREVQVEMVVQAAQLRELELWMAVWSPGFYHREDHWRQVQDVRARGDGAELAVDQPKPNHWHVATGSAQQVVVQYTVQARGRSVTGDLVGQDYAILNGCASWLTFDAAAGWPREIHVELPPQWTATATALPKAKDGKPHHFLAADWDTLADSPIVAGTLARRDFTVAGVPHAIVDFGDAGTWDVEAAVRSLAPVLEEHARMLGGLPWDHYLFLNAFGPGGGGLEHRFCTLISSDQRGNPADPHWLAFVSHEYFHAFNVKRLRPVEIGPFDYETPPHTASLWIAEGLTSWFGDLAVARASEHPAAVWLPLVSGHLRHLMATPGRAVMTLERASLDVFTTSMSGVMGAPQKTVSYYDKGPVVGLVLDARIRKHGGGKGLDDVMRLAGSRYSGVRGYREEEWEACASEVAGEDLRPFFDAAVRSTQELDLAEALDWFGLRVRPADPEATGKAARDQQWTLEVRPDATAAQQEHLAQLLRKTPAK